MGDTVIITKDETAALLGRPLTSVESNNFTLYLQVAILRLNDLLCIKLEEMGALPIDLKLLMARCFATIVEEQGASASHGITNKKVEDFSISFDVNATSPMVAFVNQNSATIDKYGMCQGPVRSGGSLRCGGIL